MRYKSTIKELERLERSISKVANSKGFPRISAERLKELRHKQGITQRELAESCGLGLSTIKQYESGQRVPEAWNLFTLADYYNVEPQWIVGFYEERKELTMEIKFDFSMLRGKIREVCGSELKFGDAMGWSQTTLYAKLNGQVDFKQSEILKACEILDIMTEFIPVYFFTVKVSNSKLEEGDEDESL